MDEEPSWNRELESNETFRTSEESSESDGSLTTEENRKVAEERVGRKPRSFSLASSDGYEKEQSSEKDRERRTTIKKLTGVSTLNRRQCESASSKVSNRQKESSKFLLETETDEEEKRSDCKITAKPRKSARDPSDSETGEQETTTVSAVENSKKASKKLLDSGSNQVRPNLSEAIKKLQNFSKTSSDSESGEERGKISKVSKKQKDLAKTLSSSETDEEEETEIVEELLNGLKSQLKIEKDANGDEGYVFDINSDSRSDSDLEKDDEEAAELFLEEVKKLMLRRDGKHNAARLQ